MMERKNRVKFASEHIKSLLYGNKCITVGFDRAEGLEEGDRIILVDENGDKFGEATVDWIREMKIKDFVGYKLDGHRTYSSSESLIAELERYYPERGHITAIQNIDVMWLRDITPIEDIDFIDTTFSEEQM